MRRPTTGIAVDASKPGSGGNGPTEYRGLDLATGQELFHFGPYQNTTINVGEFLAIVEGLKRGNPVYSDSTLAIYWIHQGYASPYNPHLLPDNVVDLMEQARTWLRHNPRIDVRQWYTGNWGENPADFGRKPSKSKSGLKRT